MRHTLRTLCMLLCCITGISVCRETMRRLLQERGLSFKKAHMLLGKACPARRVEFVTQLGELVQAAQLPDGPLLVFCDEAHLHLDVEPGYGWAPRGQRLYVNSNSPGLGKKRTCFGLYLYGAAQPVQIHTAAWANAHTTCQMLQALRAAHPHQPLVLVWDNVRYHHAKAVRQKAQELGIRLMYLPPYSPDLMPVERLWSWLRQELTYLHCHGDEQELCDRIAAFVDRLLDCPAEVHRRLKPKLRLHQDTEDLLVSG